MIFPGILLLLVLVFFLGPKPSYPDYSPAIDATELRQSLSELQQEVAKREAQIPNLKKDNGSLFLWADSLPQQTEYCLLFLHGFSASPKAADPVMVDFAKRYGMNLFAPLLAGHGINSKESFVDLSPADLINSAKEAFRVAKRMGKKVIVSGSSTGCTLGIYLSAHNPDFADALMLYSPNIDLAASSSKVLLWPWGKQIASLLSGKYFQYEKLIGTPNEQYWTTTYRMEGLQALKYLISETMTEEVFSKINVPVMVGYWYKNEEIHDETVSIPRMKDFYAQVQTPANQKQMLTFPDVNSHVLLCDLQCQDVDDVFEKSVDFAENILRLTSVTP